MKSDTKIGIAVVLLLVAVVGVLLGREIMHRKSQLPQDMTASTASEGTDVSPSDAPLPSDNAETLIAGVKNDVADPDPKDVLFDPAHVPSGLEPLPGEKGPVAEAVESPDAGPATPQEYVVKSGDRGETIAKQVYGRKFFGKQSAWELIAAANPGVNANRLKIGMRLVIPAAPAASEAAPVAHPADSVFTNVAGTRTYTVKSGDLLSGIAKKFYGKQSAWELIAAANPGVNPNRLRIGTVLNIPDAPAGTGGPKPAPQVKKPVEPWKTHGATRLVTSRG